MMGREGIGGGREFFGKHMDHALSLCNLSSSYMHFRCLRKVL